jgi:PERQ amino acid-rich with GYF domain-containing protein
MEPTSSTVPIIPQQRPPVIIDDKQWFYKDPQNTIQGPFSSADMERWFAAGYFTILLPVKRLGETQFSTIQQLTKELGRLPFRTDVSSVPSTPVQKQQQLIAPEPQKFNPMTYVSSSSTSNNAFFDEYLMQQQQQQQQSRQNVQNPLLYNR